MGKHRAAPCDMDCFHCIYEDCVECRTITKEEARSIKQALAERPIRERNRAYNKWLHRFSFTQKELAAIAKYTADLEDFGSLLWKNYARMNARDLREFGINYERETANV